MSEFENLEASELSMDEMNEVSGGASRFDPLPAKTGFTVYKVKTGDTLTRIAHHHNCSVAEIMAWNPKISNRNRIYANEYLYIRLFK